MTTVSVTLKSAWPTAQGLRRPLEGPIIFSIEEAIRIVENGCGEFSSKADKKAVSDHKAAAKKAAADQAEAERLAAEQAEAEKPAAEKAAAEKAAAEKAAAEKAEAEKAANSAQS